MDGTATIGVGTTWARSDHIHPTDTSRAPLNSPTFTGTVTIPAGASISGYAPIAAPVFTGDARAVTPTYGDNDTSIATTAFVQTAVAPAQNNAGRNRLHNARFSINQRSYVSGTALAAGAYAHDRWKAGASGCTYTFSQSQPGTTITITAGSLQQIVEAMAVEGGTYTLSWTGTAQGKVNAGAYAASPVTIAGLAVNTAITVEFNTGTLTGVQLEIGTQATPLEKPDPQQDLAKCQRFYQTGIAGWWGNTAAGQAFGYTIHFPVAMRSAPSVTLSGQGYANASAATAGNPSIGGFNFNATGTAAGTAAATSDWQASADL